MQALLWAKGAGIVILRSLEHALQRGARIYAEISGYGYNARMHIILRLRRRKALASKCMSLAIKDAGLKPEDVDYINAHGTSTPLNDLQ